MCLRLLAKLFVEVSTGGGEGGPCKGRKTRRGRGEERGWGVDECQCSERLKDVQSLLLV